MRQCANTWARGAFLVFPSGNGDAAAERLRERAWAAGWATVLLAGREEAGHRGGMGEYALEVFLSVWACGIATLLPGRKTEDGRAVHLDLMLHIIEETTDGGDVIW